MLFADGFWSATTAVCRRSLELAASLALANFVALDFGKHGSGADN
jgi:hypothetical protein